MNKHCEDYKYEDNLYELFKSLPLDSQEFVFNGCDGYAMDSQDWIDYELDELPHEKCKEYGMYSPQEISAYNDRFQTCDNVYKKVYSDGSSDCWCHNGAYENSDGTCGLNISNECYQCTQYELRTDSVNTYCVDEEVAKREQKRLLEMLQYATIHLKNIGSNSK